MQLGHTSLLGVLHCWNILKSWSMSEHAMPIFVLIFCAPISKSKLIHLGRKPYTQFEVAFGMHLCFSLCFAWRPHRLLQRLARGLEKLHPGGDPWHAASSAGRPIFENLPWDQFWEPGVVKNGFLAIFHAGLTYIHNFSTDFFENHVF